MTQADDDLATRELHLLTISNGTLYHSLASNWSPATSGSGSFTFDRFNTVTPWGDVGQALGTNFGADRRLGDRRLAPDGDQRALRRPGERRQISPLAHRALLRRLVAPG